MPGASFQKQRNSLADFRRSLLSLFYIDILSLAQTKHFTPKAHEQDVIFAPGLARDKMEISRVLGPIYLPLDFFPAGD